MKDTVFKGALRITVAPPRSVEEEASVLKTALLYADQVSHYGVHASALKPVLDKLDAGAPEQVAGLLDFLEGDAEREVLRLLEQGDPSTDVNIICANIRLGMSQDSDATTDLIDALDSGLVSVQENWSAFDWIKSQDPDMEFQRLLRIFEEELKQPSVYPLFTTNTLGLDPIPTALNEDKSFNMITDRAKIFGLAHDLMRRLPRFESATVKEILDIRKDLRAPLRRFRSSLIKFSEQIKSAPWDIDFQFDADRLFHKEIEASVIEMEESVRSNKYLVMLSRKLLDKPLALPAGSALGLALSNFSVAPPIAAQVLGATLGFGAIALDALKEWSQSAQATRRNQLYFYYDAITRWGSR